MAEDIKIIRSNRRSLSLHILRDGTIEVKAPFFMPGFMIRQFVEKNSDWVEKKKQLVQNPMSLPKTYTHGETFFYLGNAYSLDIGDYTSISIKEDKLLFPKALLFRAKKELEYWYIRQAKEIITSQVQRYAEEMKTSYIAITFSDTKSQWGRCTHDNRLQFSWRLVMAPLLVLNYVVVHELAHTKEKNHSYLFWSIVRGVTPSYKQQIKWLKTHGTTLVV